MKRQFLFVALACFVGAALVATRACAEDRFELRAFVIYSSGAAMDLWSTERALDRGLVEGNPAMRGSFGKRLAIKAASTAAVTYLDSRITSRKWRWISRGAWVLGHFALAVHNDRKAR